MQRNNGNIFGGIGLINAESVKAKLKNMPKKMEPQCKTC